MAKGKDNKEGQPGNMVRTLWIILTAVFLQDITTGNFQNRSTACLCIAVIVLTVFIGLFPFTTRRVSDKNVGPIC
jgi:hypothetical protein